MNTSGFSRGHVLVAASVFTLAGVLALRPVQTAAPAAADQVTIDTLRAADGSRADEAIDVTHAIHAIEAPQAAAGRRFVEVPASVTAPAVVARPAVANLPAVYAPAAPVVVAPAQTEPVRRAAAPKRSWQERAVVIGGSSGAGAAIGALIGGKKGALIGAAIGGGGGTLYEVIKHR